MSATYVDPRGPIRTNAMLPGPVFDVELATSSRRARYYALRFLYGAILLFLVIENDPANYPSYYGANGSQFTIQQTANLGRWLFTSFAFTQSAVVLFLTPPLFAGVIAEEKQRRTLQYLLASRLSSAEIVLGKLCARALHIGVFLTLGVPVLSMFSLFGGVPPELVYLTFASSVTTVFFLASLSLLVSTYARRPREAISLVYVFELAWLFLPWMLTTIMPAASGIWLLLYEQIRPVVQWVFASSPIALMRILVLGVTPSVLPTFTWMVGLQVSFGVLFLVTAILRLRPVYRKQGESSRWVTVFKSLQRGKRLLPRPACGDDPMVWKERYVSRTSAFTKVVGCLVGVLVGGVIAYSSFDLAVAAFREVSVYGYGSTTQNTARHAFSMFLRFLSAVAYAAWVLAVASAASTSITHEREADTWMSLMATPLEGSQVLLAKMFGAVWSTRWMALLLFVLWTLGLAAGSLHPVGFIAAIVEVSVFIWFAAALGTAVSLRIKHSSQAMTVTVGIMLLLNGGYTLCCIPLEPDTALITVGVTPVLVGSTLISYENLAELLGNTGLYWSRHYTEMCAACVFGTFGYAVLAFGIMIRAMVAFDKAVDRPRRLGYIAGERSLDEVFREIASRAASDES